jgi:hypothetical protein
MQTGQAIMLGWGWEGEGGKRSTGGRECNPSQTKAGPDDGLQHWWHAPSRLRAAGTVALQWECSQHVGSPEASKVWHK